MRNVLNEGVFFVISWTVKIERNDSYWVCGVYILLHLRWSFSPSDNLQILSAAWLSSFRLSDYSLDGWKWKNGNFKSIHTKIHVGGTIKRIYENGKITSVNKLIVFFQKDRVSGSGLELLSAGFIKAVCHDSIVSRIREELLSITWELLKSVVIWSSGVFSDVGTSCAKTTHFLRVF